jgi:hypothetical protein
MTILFKILYIMILFPLTGLILSEVLEITRWQVYAVIFFILGYYCLFIEKIIKNNME